MGTLIFIALVLFQVLVNQCCRNEGGGLLHILRVTNTRTCRNLAGLHERCPNYGSGFDHACRCGNGLFCYVAPSGVIPMFGQCITPAEHQQKLEWIKNNPWVKLIP